MRNFPARCAALVVLVAAILGCKQLANVGETNLFQGDNAAKAAAAIKSKISADHVKVIRAEVRKDSMKITIQAADNPKNMDEYTFEKGKATGPKPVQAMSFGNLEMTADKYHVTDLSDINFGAIPDTVQKAITRSGLEKGQVDLISMENATAETVNPNLKAEKKRKADDLKKQITDKMTECLRLASSKCSDELRQLQKQQMNSMMGGGEKQWDLAWRIFVEGPRGRKDFYADKQGAIVENPY